MTMTTSLSERSERLWVPVLAPIIWAVHFTICTVAASLACGRFGDASGLVTPRSVIFVVTVVAIGAMALLFVHGLRRRGAAWPVRPHDADTAEDRRHFMAFTTMLLSGLSIIGTVFVVLAAVLVRGCP